MMMALPLHDKIDEIRTEFPATARMGYFNTGTIAPLPRRVLEAHQSLERQYHLAGPLDRETGDRVNAEYDAVRPKIASMLRTTPDRIALADNTTTGINAALLSQTWQPGDEVLTSDIEHPAVLLPLEYLRQRYGASVRRVATRGGVLRTDDLSAAIGPNSRAVVISHVSFITGGVFPVEEICLLARDRSLLSVIDGAQSVGAMPVDLSRLQCDYYAFPGYKWTLGPQGTAGLFVSERAPEVLPYRVASHAVAERFAGGGFRLHGDARRFEGTGTTAKMEFISLGGSIDLLAGYGWGAVFGRVAGLGEQFRAGVQAIPGAELITPRSRDEAAGLISFRVAGRSAAEMADQLYHQGMVIRTVAGNGLRASFHFYNTPEEVDRLLDAIRDLVA